MAPIYESDLAENRWKEAEWHYFEFWEETEKRARRRRTFWIVGTVIIFLALTALPVVRARAPQWAAQDVARRFALELNRVKSEAGVRRAALRIRSEDQMQGWIVEEAPHCGSAESAWGLVRRVELRAWAGQETRLLPPNRAQALGQPGLVDRFCYDPWTGMELSGASAGLLGVGFAPTSDLEQDSIDRAFVLLVSGQSGEPQL